jgi:hypothetical protein
VRAENAVVAIELEGESGSALAGAPLIPRPAHHPLELGGPRVVDPETTVDRGDAVVAVRQLVVGEHHADGGLLQHVPVETKDTDARILVVKRAVRRRELARRLVVDEQRSDRVLP